MPGEALSERDQERVLELSWALAGARSLKDLTTAAIEKTHELVGADDTGFNAVDLPASQIDIIAYGDALRAHELESRSNSFVSITNPIFNEILLQERRTPFLISDIMPSREFLRTELYE